MLTDLAVPPSATRRRGRAVLTSLACLLLGAGCWFVGAGFTLDESPQPVPSVVSAVLGLDAVLGIAAAAAVGPLRRAGIWNLVIVFLGVLSAWAIPAFVVAAIRIGRLRALRTDIAAVLIALVAWLAYSLAVPRFGSTADVLVYEAAIVVVVTVSLLLWGRARSTRAALITSLRAQADAAQRERSAEVQRVLAEERVALARDMHDGLSHHLSLISMHAGALAYRDDISPARVREVGQTLRDSATAAHADLRHLLLSLREQSADTRTDTAPLADPASIDDLIVREQERGARIRVERDGLPATDLAEAHRPAAVALERILAEALVNARKHAPGAPVTVQLGLEEDEGDDSTADVVLRVMNPLTDDLSARGVKADPTGAGLGLTGIAERARLLDGTARWQRSHLPRADTQTPEEDTAFTLEVRIPWTR